MVRLITVFAVTQAVVNKLTAPENQGRVLLNDLPYNAYVRGLSGRPFKAQRQILRGGASLELNGQEVEQSEDDADAEQSDRPRHVGILVIGDVGVDQNGDHDLALSRAVLPSRSRPQSARAPPDDNGGRCRRDESVGNDR